VLELVHPGLTILDAVTGLEGNGPGASGTPHSFQCVAASTDPVALDAVFTHAMGYRKGEVLHLADAGERKLGNTDLEQIKVEGSPSSLRFGHLQLPTSRWFFNIPSWLSAPISHQLKLHPSVDIEKCTGCGTCSTVCPAKVITKGKPPVFQLDGCIGCMCCGESCPEGAITPKRNLIAKMVGMNG
jgi:NAD-dependent dihydropyrimidine dehydrogenase PreA subunit